MAQQTKALYNDIMKEMYKKPVIDALPELVPLYDKFKKQTWTIGGKKAVLPVRTARQTTGVGPIGETAALPTASYQESEAHVVNERYNALRIQLTDAVIEASKRDDGAFERALQFEMKYGILDLTNELDVQAYHDGTGTRALVQTAGSVTTLELEYAGASSGAATGEPGSRYLKAGQTVMIGTTTTLAAGSADFATISAINDDDTVTIGSTTVAEHDLIVLAQGSAASTSNSYLKAWEGLDSALISSGTYQGVVLSSYPAFAAQVKTNPAGAGTDRTLTGDIMQSVVDAVERNSSGKIDLIVGDITMRRPFLDQVVSDKRFLTGSLDAGYSKLTFNTIPMLFTRNCPYSKLYFLDCSTWYIFETVSKMHWMNEDGAILSRVSGYAAYEAIMLYNANMTCEDPSCNGVLKDVDAKY